MSKNSSDVVITSALRTPIGRYKGSLKNLSASKLGSIAIKEVIYKSKLDLEEIDEVIMGHVLTSGLGQNPCLLYTSPSPRDGLLSRMPSSA